MKRPRKKRAPLPSHHSISRAPSGLSHPTYRRKQTTACVFTRSSKTRLHDRVTPAAGICTSPPTNFVGLFTNEIGRIYTTRSSPLARVVSQLISVYHQNCRVHALFLGGFRGPFCHKLTHTFMHSISPLTMVDPHDR